MSRATQTPADSHDIGVLRAGYDYESVTDRIATRVLAQRRGPWSWRWWLVLGIAFAGTAVFFIATVVLFALGPGIWGINIPVAWGFAIANFVWWIGIGHAGTFISAVLLLLHQKWRTSINRFAEAMTLFAAGIAGIFPILHLGRPWFFYWLVPYPNRMDLWPQWRSPLVWDLFAISTYLLVSLLFWYVGLIPDLATLRDRALGAVGRDGGFQPDARLHRHAALQCRHEGAGNVQPRRQRRYRSGARESQCAPRLVGAVRQLGRGRDRDEPHQQAIRSDQHARLGRRLALRLRDQAAYDRARTAWTAVSRPDLTPARATVAAEPVRKTARQSVQSGTCPTVRTG